jgi:hypothetical protein
MLSFDNANSDPKIHCESAKFRNKMADQHKQDEVGRDYFAGLKVTKRNKATVLLTLTLLQTPTLTITLILTLTLT